VDISGLGRNVGPFDSICVPCGPPHREGFTDRKGDLV